VNTNPGAQLNRLGPDRRNTNYSGVAGPFVP
jgi:hypothetical protein